MAVIDSGNSAAGKANVNANYELTVALHDGTTPSRVGAVRAFSEVDTGTETGTPLLRSGEVSQDYRQRVGQDTILFHYEFNATSQNTGIWRHAFTTMTMTQSAGFLNVNAAGTSTVSGNYAYLMTWRTFPLIGTAPIAVEFIGQFSLTPTANEVYQAGLGTATGAAEPVDGCWFEFTSAGLSGCTRYNSGATTKVTLVADPSTLPTNSNSHYVIVIGQRSVEFWIDDVLYGEIETPAAQGQPFISSALPLFTQKYNANTVGASPNMVVRIGSVTVTMMDMAAHKPWAHQMAGIGLAGQGLDGGTMGANTFFTNSAYPTTALPVNTALTSNLPTGLTGGRGLATLWNLAATDMILTQAQNPTGGVNQTGRVMYITGVSISACSYSAAWTAPAAGQHLIQFGIYHGGSAVSLAQTESTSFATGTAKAHRRRFLGMMGWASGTAPIGTPADHRIRETFETPIVVNPGEYVGLFAQMINGAATASGGLMFTYNFDHYFE